MITAPMIRQIVTYPLLIERLRAAYSEFSSFAIPPTTRHAIVTSGSPHGQSALPSLLLMPTWGIAANCPYILVKSVTVFPENGSKGLPAVAGTYVLSSLETGKLFPPSYAIRFDKRHICRKHIHNCNAYQAIAIAITFRNTKHPLIPSTVVALSSSFKVCASVLQFSST